MAPDPDFAERLRRLKHLAARRGVDTLVLREPATISWLTGGRSHVPQTLDTSCADIIVDVRGEPAAMVVVNAIEAPRLRDTEFADLPLAWTTVPWWEDRTGSLPVGRTVGSDRPGAASVNLSGDLAALRRELTPYQAGLLGGVCADAAEATTAAALRVRPGMTEYAAAATLTDELLSRGLDPIALFVAADRRAAVHRHPLPTMTIIGERVMLVCCARRSGLVSSVTRIRCFRPPSAAEQSAYRRLLDVEAAFLNASRPGTRLGDAFTAGTAAYAEHGFDATEWHRHHQGGFSGWHPREYLAHEGSDDVITEHSVVAWNPSADSWKVEDTCLISREGLRPLVDDGHWPTLTVAGRRRPDLLTV
ncbi:Xaa-Pro peptidase family protein [Actinomadura sp. K4S16]|uniref:M24 family metallopeptidase n=1 Tax=Actinomadura sp. K4S16 TaxID=1316147 RepID=UPI001356C147|nr:M24 family metallopeptidase [Actinomadura sp. K4S16]